MLLFVAGLLMRGRLSPLSSAEEPSEQYYDINNGSIVPMLEAVHKRSSNRYVGVLQVARKAQQRAELQRMAGGLSDVKPLIAQLQQELELYQAEMSENKTDLDFAQTLDDNRDLNFREDPGTRG